MRLTMKLWGGRFTKETNELVHNFNASISFDQKFYKQDILGSIAHVTMLEKQGIITADEKEQIIGGCTFLSGYQDQESHLHTAIWFRC